MVKSLKQAVLDLIKPHEPSIVEISKAIGNLKGITGINTVVYDVDRDVESIKLTVEGEKIPINTVVKELEKHGASVHGIDEISYGEKIIKEVSTPRDRWISRRE